MRNADYTELTPEYREIFKCESETCLNDASHVISVLVTCNNPLEFDLQDMSGARLICTKCYNNILNGEKNV